MTDVQTKQPTFPKIPTKSWYALRQRAQTSPSTRLTADTVAALLGLAGATSAQNNILRPLVTMGLIDANGVLTERGQKWRVDASYADACREVIEAVYPDGISALTDDSGKPDLGRVMTWFQHRGFGQSNASQMASTFMLLADPSPEPKEAVKSERPQRRATATRARTTNAPKVALNHDPAPSDPSAAKTDRGRPDLHIDVQVHVAADASADQIDHVFASMAKHLYAS